MKIRIPIMLDIDTDAPGTTRGGVGTNPATGERKGNIEVRSDIKDSGEDLLTVVAHEFGHVIARLFDLPEHASGYTNGQLRQIQGFFGRLPKPVLDKSVALEKEAWSVAHKMGLPLDKPTEDYAIRSYETDGRSLNEPIKRDKPDPLKGRL